MNGESRNSAIHGFVRESETRLTEKYPAGFSWEELSAIKSFAGQLRYVSERLEKIGSGSARTVFAIDDEKVLKVASNPKGIAQNAEENKLSDDSYLTGLFAKVLKCSDDNRFLEMERARKCTKKEFQRYTGVSMDVATSFFWFFDSNVLRNTRCRFQAPENVDELYENDFLSTITDFAGCYDVPLPGDFSKLSTYGFVERDGEKKLVMVDYGFSGDVAKMYRRD